MSKNFWLMKSEPDVSGLLINKKRLGPKELHGMELEIIKYQPAKNLKTMKKGDQCFLPFKYWQRDSWNCESYKRGLRRQN